MAFVHLRHKKHRRFFSRRTPFDKFVDLAAFAYPAVGIPQIAKVFQGDVSGVSLLYWLGTGVYSIIFLIYGIKHRVEPMIIIYSLWVIINFLVLAGLFINR